MNYFVQRGKVRSQVINVPEGLPELLSDITREVLRCQPTTECLCQFIIDYLHSVIVTRDKARTARSIIDRALIKVDEIISDMCVCDIPAMKAEQMALAMEGCFKHFLAKRRCDVGRDREIIKFSEIDILDELIQRCRFSEDELKISRPAIETAYKRFVDAYMSAQKQTEGTEALYQYFREREAKREEERQQKEAATKIQAAVRGFLTRRSLLHEKQTSVFEMAAVSEDSLFASKEQNEAARKIQKFFRSRISERKSQVQDQVEEDNCSPGSVLDLYMKTSKKMSRLSRMVDYEEMIGTEGAGSAAVVSNNIADNATPQQPQKQPTSVTPVVVIDDDETAIDPEQDKADNEKKRTRNKGTIDLNETEPEVVIVEEEVIE